MSEESVSKELVALNGALVGQVYLTDWQYQENSWHFDVLAGVPDGIDKLYGRRESVIEGRRYVVVAENGGYETEALATQACISRIGEILEVLTRKADS